MLKRCLLFAVLLVPHFVSAAAEISDLDVARYGLVHRDGHLTSMEMRLSRMNGKWVMDGRNGVNAPWANISCDPGCQYRESTSQDTDRYLASFPATMQQQFTIACIQNIANAFCRLDSKSSGAPSIYALVTLVTGRPLPMPLARLTR